MFYLEGSKECYRTAILLASVGNKAVSNISDFHKNYIDFAVSIGGEDMRPLPDEGQVCYSDDRIAKIVERYQEDSILTDIETDIIETPRESRIEAMEKILQGKKLMSEVNAELNTYFDAIIHTMFYQRSMESGGGSVSSSLGVIWCSPRRSWAVEDIAEFLVHELAHNSIFLDERRYQHYLNFETIANPQYYAMSTILKKLRPLDKAFHSLVVAHEVLSYREEAGEPSVISIHPAKDVIVSSCLITISSIREVIGTHPDIVTNRFRSLLDKVEMSINKMSDSVGLKSA